METWLKADRRGDLAPYIADEERRVHQQILVGYHTSALNWYRVLVWNLNQKDEVDDGLVVKIPCPVLMVLPPAIADQFSMVSTQSSELADDLIVKSVSTPGHWVQLEARDEVNCMLQEFFSRVDDRAPVVASTSR